MAETTGISWCERTWSPWLGCQNVSPACDHCYAEAWAKRSGLVGWGPKSPRRRTSETYWKRLRIWDAEAVAAGRRISVFPSLCDPFDNAVDPAWRRDHFAEIRATPNLDHILLTKRVGNVLDMVEAAGGDWPRNAWLGSTIVNQPEYDRDMPKAAEAKAELDIPVLLLSMEPLLAGVDVTAWIDFIDWIICGGESGGLESRPMHPDWVRQIRDACLAAGVPFHLKQWGDWASVYDRDVEDPDWRRVHEFRRHDGPNGRWMNLAGGHGFHGERVQYMRRRGTKVTGRLLDGQLHNDFPRIAA